MESDQGSKIQEKTCQIYYFRCGLLDKVKNHHYIKIENNGIVILLHNKLIM
jgi:hypothetical protein